MCHSTHYCLEKNGRETDTKTAFLQGENINCELFVLPPKEANTDKLQLLQNYPYSLADTSKKWHNKVKNVLTSLNVKLSRSDPSSFPLCHNNELQGLFAL